MQLFIYPGAEFVYGFFCKESTDFIGVLLPDSTGAEPGLFAGKKFLFKKDDISDPFLDQKIGKRTTRNATTDDEVFCSIDHQNPPLYMVSKIVPLAERSKTHILEDKGNVLNDPIDR